MESLGKKIARASERWRVVDSKFIHNKRRYLLQTLLSVITILAVLLVLDSVTHTVLIASLGASAFIAFALPRSYPSQPRYMLGGYCVGTVVGCLLSWTAGWLAGGVGLDLRLTQLVCGAVAMGLAFFLMVLTGTEHPPAAALALGYVLNEWDWGTVGVVMAGIAMLVVVTQIFRARLMDLV
ncbi:MAG: HPP family protein [Gammaproteobacteria bacterium]